MDEPLNMLSCGCLIDVLSDGTLVADHCVKHRKIVIEENYLLTLYANKTILESQ